MKFNPVKLKELVERHDSFEERVRAAAIYYTECGIPIVPLVPNTKIMPPRRMGFNYQSATKLPKTADKWFGPEGTWRGHNLGIACGREDGVCAIDIDVHTADGRKNFDKILKDHNYGVTGPTQVTPTGGYHILLRWVPGMGSTTNRICEGVDTRGGSITQYKSHIVVYPSIVPKGEYYWQDEEEIDIVSPPDWIVKLVARDEPETEMGNDDMETTVTLEQMERMLQFIPPDVPHDDWVKIGMAIHSQHPNGDGMDLWDEWSRPGETYDRSMVKAKWRSFRKGGNIRVGTLFYFAREHGWEPGPDDSVKQVRNMQLEMLNRSYAMVMVGNKARVLREVVPEDPLMPDYVIMSAEDFKMILSNEFMIEGNNEKPRLLPDAWIRWRYRRTYPAGMGMFPEGPPSEEWYNTWRGFSVEPKQGKCERFYEHINDIICNGNKEQASWVLDWMADAVQDPANPKGTAIVLRGDEGIGKGTLADKFGSLFGCHYRHLNNDSHLTGNFNAHMMDALFVFADEITWGGNRKTAGVLKGMITEKHLLGERKNVDAVSYRNMVRLMIASNADWVVPADMSSRRWFVLDVSNKRKNNFDYFEAITEEWENGGAAALLYDLQNREITHNLRRAPETKALAHQRSQSMPTSLRWWYGILETGVLDAPDEEVLNIKGMKRPNGRGNEEIDASWPSLVRCTNLYALYEDWGLSKNHIVLGASTFYMHMERVGLKLTRRETTGGIKPRCFEIPDREEAAAIFANKIGMKVEDLI